LPLHPVLNVRRRGVAADFALDSATTTGEERVLRAP
jgi:hypothetical protein